MTTAGGQALCGQLRERATARRESRRHQEVASDFFAEGDQRGELWALRWGDVHDATILVQRAADPDGSSKATKNRHRRSIRLLAPLAQDMREYRLAIGRPPSDRLILRDHRNGPWDKSAWQMWRADRWVPACGAAGPSPIPRPYDLRHSFASLLLAEGRQPLDVAGQFGHSLAMLLETYAHLMEEYAEREPIDAET